MSFPSLRNLSISRQEESVNMAPTPSRARRESGPKVGYFDIFFAEYISPQGAIGLKRYKYQATNTSIWYNKVAGPLAGWLVARTPVWIAPNVITLIGFVCVLAAYELVYFWCPTFTEEAPKWVWLAVSGLLFAYRTLDNMDGKQARRLGCGTPLGLSLDHGCDAVTCCLIPAIGCAYLQLGLTFWTVIFVVIPPITAFFLTWEEFYTGVFTLGTFNGVDEGGLITDVLFLLGGIAGESSLANFTSMKVIPSLGLEMKHCCVVLMGCLGLYTILPSIINVIRTEKWKKAMFNEFNDSVETVQRISEITTTDDESASPESHPWSARHYQGKRPRVRDAFGAVLPVLLGSALWIGSVYFPLKQSRLLLRHTRTMIWLSVMLFSKLITHLHVAHVCGDPYYQWRKTFLIPVALISANSFYSDYLSPDGSTVVDEVWLLYVCATVATVSWVHMAYSVVTGMCRVLNIPFLRVPQACLIQFAAYTPLSSTKKRKNTKRKIN